MFEVSTDKTQLIHKIDHQKATQKSASMTDPSLNNRKTRLSENKACIFFNPIVVKG